MPPPGKLGGPGTGGRQTSNLPGPDAVAAGQVGPSGDGQRRVITRPRFISGSFDHRRATPVTRGLAFHPKGLGRPHPVRGYRACCFSWPYNRLIEAGGGNGFSWEKPIRKIHQSLETKSAGTFSCTGLPQSLSPDPCQSGGLEVARRRSWPPEAVLAPRGVPVPGCRVAGLSGLTTAGQVSYPALNSPISAG